MAQRLGQRNGVEDRDALPRAERDVVDPTTVSAADIALRPVVEQDRCREVLLIAGGMCDAKQRIDSVGTTPVNDAAGRAEQRSMERGVGERDLMRRRAVAPALQ